jgi:predicted dehydrogenase
VSPGKPLRVGLVGLGWFGRTHLDAWASVHGATVVGVCDRDPNALNLHANRAQEDFHTDAGADGTPEIPADLPRYSTVDALLASGIDLLDVVVTEDEHEKCVRAALAASVHVVVEKPLALDLDAVTDLARLADRVDRRIYVGQVLRFDPRHVALAEMVRGNELRHLSLSRHFQTSAHDVYGRTHPVLNAAVHDIDLAVWLTGEKPNRVTAFASHFLGRQHPDAVDLVVEWDSGLRAVIQNSWHLAAGCPYGFTFDCTVHTTADTYTVRSEPVLQRWSADSVTAPELFFWPRYAGARSGALVAELQHFADCAARGEASSRVPLSDVLAVMSTCQAAMEALENGRPQEVRRPADLMTGGEPGYG